MSLDSVSISNQSLIITGLSTDTKPTTTMSATNKFLETDTGDVYEYSGSSWIKLVESGAVISEPNQIAHERNIGTANQYGVGVPECNYFEWNQSVGSTLVYSGPALVFGVQVNVLTAGGIINIEDGTDDTGPVILSIPSGAIQGDSWDLKGAKLNTGLYIHDASSAGEIIIFWRPQ